MVLTDKTYKISPQIKLSWTVWWAVSCYCGLEMKAAIVMGWNASHRNQCFSQTWTLGLDSLSQGLLSRDSLSLQRWRHSRLINTYYVALCKASEHSVFIERSWLRHFRSNETENRTWQMDILSDLKAHDIILKPCLYKNLRVYQNKCPTWSNNVVY